MTEEKEKKKKILIIVISNPLSVYGHLFKSN